MPIKRTGLNLNNAWKTLQYRYKYITTLDEVDLLIDHCKTTGYCSSDFETSGTNAMYPGSYPTLLGVSFQPGGAWIIPLGHKDSPFRKRNKWKSILQYFGREVIENPNIVKIGQNIKFEMNWWRKYGIIMQGRVFDTMLAKYLLEEERPHGLKTMVARYMPEYDGYDLPGQPTEKADVAKIIEFWSNVLIRDLAEYCALDADLTFRLWIFFESRLIDNHFYPLFRNLMMMASRVLAEAEWQGMYVDRDYLENLVEIYREKINECEARLRSNAALVKYEKRKVKSIRKGLIKKTKKEIKVLKKEGASDRMILNRKQKISSYIAGETTNNKDAKLFDPTNFNSPKQLADLLFTSKHGFGFEIVKYTMDKKTKRETETISVDEDVLIELNQKDDSGFMSALLELRSLTKLNSTYVLGMWNKLLSTNKIHGSFLLHGTVTGRLSSRNPNLQNIPRDTTSSDIKLMFIPPPGKLLFQLDYSQAELRVLAAAARETTMIQWFADGRDIHSASAADKWDVEYSFVLKMLEDEDHKDYKLWKARRKQAKTINFGIVYGQTAKKLSVSLSTDEHKVSLGEAQGFLDDFNQRFPKINKHIRRQQRYAAKHGYVYNLFGRKRRLPNISDSNWGKKAEAQRQAVNAPIQGAASDFTLFSSVLIREAIINGSLPKTLVQIGTVHDSLLYYIDPEDIHGIIPKLYAICRNPETKLWFNFEVRGIEMKVDFEIGINWGELRNYSKEIDYAKLVT